MSIIIGLLLTLSASDAANILGVFLYPSESHNILGSILLENLAKRGHNVTFISGFPKVVNQPNFTHVYVDDIMDFKQGIVRRNMQRSSSYFGIFDRVDGIKTYEVPFLESSELKFILKSNTSFDLMIHFAGMDAGLALAHHFDVPVIVFSPFGGSQSTKYLFANPASSAYVPTAFLPFSDKMTFFQRLVNFIYGFMLQANMKMSNANSNKALQKYLPTFPPIEEIQKRIHLGFVNSHISTETPRPYLPALVQIGGYHLQDTQPLPEDLQKILDQATNGTIFVSFGTNVNVSAIPEEKLGILVQSLGELPLKVLMKFDGDNLDNQPDNVEFRRWYPQRAVLSHPNVKLFISHGGYASCLESLYYGVPMICIPFTVDQPKNCADVERRGYGIRLLLSQLTKQTLGQALQRVLYDDKFISKAELISELYRDQEMNPMDRAAYWVNHVIKHKGAGHLRCKALDLPWYQYYLLDVVLFIICAIFLFIILAFCALKYVWYALTRRMLKVKVS